MENMKWLSKLCYINTLGYYTVMVNEVADWIKIANQTHIPPLPQASKNLEMGLEIL